MGAKEYASIAMRSWRSVILGVAVVLCFAGTTAQAQSCTPKKGGYACDLSVFKQELAQAQTIAIKASPRDRIGQRQLQELAAALGKSVAAEGVAGDLVVEVVPTDNAGVSIGPAARDLAVLRVTDGKTGALAWLETYSGSADVPWPAVVHAVIVQFQQRLKV